MTPPVLVLGIGSPFQEDQVGIRLVEQLREEGFSSGLPGIILEYETLDRPGWALLGILQGADCAILVDAMRSGRTPGSLWRLGIGDLPPRDPVLTSHEIGVSAVLRLGRSLGLLPDRLILYGFEIGPPIPAFSLERHPPDEEAVQTLRMAIRRDLRTLFPDCAGTP